MRVILIGLIIFLEQSQIFAQQDTAGHKPKYLRNLLKTNLNPIAVPTIQNSPETSWNFGVGVSYYFKTDTNTTTRSSSVAASANYSLRQQFQTESRWQIFTKKERMLYRGFLSYANFVDKFWGIGSNTSEQELSEFTFTRLQIQKSALYKIFPNVFVGSSFQFSRFWDLDWFLKDESLQLGSLKGSQGSQVAGWGAMFIADFRDNPFSTQTGYYAELSSVYYRDYIGSQSHFEEYLIDVRYFRHLGRQHVLAFQGFGNFMQGNIPFRELPRLGGAQIMRGYFNGRFIDKNLIAAQVEYRMPLWKRLACSFFVSTGQVMPTLNQIHWQSLKVGYGAGIRFLLNPKESIYVRFDYALTTNMDSGFYIRINESF